MLITTSIRRAIAYGQESPETREIYYQTDAWGGSRYYVANAGDAKPHDMRKLPDWREAKL